MNFLKSRKVQILKSTSNPGFTLLEIILVISILALLAAIAVPTYQNYFARSESSEIVMLYDRLRTGLEIDRVTAGSLDCSELQARASEITPNRYASVSVGLNAVQGVTQGYKPVMLVSARNDQQGAEGIAVARAALDELAALGRVLPGEVITDTMISFSARLSDYSGADCILAQTASGAPPNNNNVVAQTTTGSATTTTAAASSGPDPQQQPPQPDPAAGQAQAGTPAIQPPADPPQPVATVKAPPPVVTPSEALVCGDMVTGIPCTDLELVLADTQTCTADAPYAINRVKMVADDLALEFRYCATAQQCAATVSTHQPTCFNLQANGMPAVGVECHNFVPVLVATQ